MQDSLFRISQKAFIQNNAGEVLVVRETGRSQWDLPGGGMEHSEGITEALARELREEIGYGGKFTYEILHVDEPHLLNRGVWQVRLIYKITPETYDFGVGDDGDEIAWINPDDFKHSEAGAERLVCFYARKIRGDNSYDAYMPQQEQ